jgi:hypothetical protein
MITLTRDETRFLLHRAIQKLPASVLRDLRGSDEARRRALEIAADAMLAHLAEAGHEVVRPEHVPGHMVDTPTR